MRKKVLPVLLIFIVIVSIPVAGVLLVELPFYKELGRKSSSLLNKDKGSSVFKDYLSDDFDDEIDPDSITEDTVSWTEDLSLEYLDECISNYDPAFDIATTREENEAFGGGFIASVNLDGTLTLDNGLIVPFSQYPVHFTELFFNSYNGEWLGKTTKLHEVYTYEELLGVLDEGDYIDTWSEAPGLERFIMTRISCGIN